LSKRGGGERGRKSAPYSRYQEKKEEEGGLPSPLGKEKGNLGLVVHSTRGERKKKGGGPLVLQVLG